MTTALFDTCIVLDVLQKREPFFDDAHKLFLAVANRRIKGCLTAKSILDIFYLFHRQSHNADETRKSISALLNLFEILDTSAIDCRKAILSGISDYEDAVMTETAITNPVQRFNAAGRSGLRSIQKGLFKNLRFFNSPANVTAGKP